MKPIDSEFLFALTNPGSEKALKLEVETSGLGWRLSYQRRGFVTFKSDQPFSLADLETNPACARRLCLSLGKSTSREEAVNRASVAEMIHHARFADRKMQGVEGDAPKIGQLVGTVVELAPAEFWTGIHRHAPFLSPDPAGDAGLEMPADSPSRAWLKLEEAARFFDLNFTPRDIVVELGCAPGGVVLALLNRGVSVIGVDPAKMADVVMASAITERNAAPTDRPWFFHSRKPAALTSKRDLGQGVTWFMSDMNQSPEVVLKECARFCQMAPSIHGVLITLKLTDLSQVAEKTLWFSALEEMGFKTILLQQLSVHHKEFALLGLKRKQRFGSPGNGSPSAGF
jgi:23S rRNA (cytidine2498-2'-O)-methyltransferase